MAEVNRRLDFGVRVAGEKAQMPDEFITLSQLPELVDTSVTPYNEDLIGEVNNINTDFITSYNYVSNAIIVTKNGVVLTPGEDYVEISENAIRFAIPPSNYEMRDLLHIYYYCKDLLAYGAGVPYNEPLNGIIDGANVTFTTTRSYIDRTTIVIKNGVVQTLNTDYYELGNNVISFVIPPIAIGEPDSLYIYYFCKSPGTSGSGDAYYWHTQMVASNVWHIIHNLGKKPSVMVTDMDNQVVIGDIMYINDNVLDVYFTQAFSGNAYLN